MSTTTYARPNGERRQASEVKVNTETKQRWEPMRLGSVGHVSRVVKGGGGKISSTVGDPGEPRKEKPQDH